MSDEIKDFVYNISEMLIMKLLKGHPFIVE